MASVNGLENNKDAIFKSIKVENDAIICGDNNVNGNINSTQMDQLISRIEALESQNTMLQAQIDAAIGLSPSEVTNATLISNVTAAGVVDLPMTSLDTPSFGTWSSGDFTITSPGIYCIGLRAAVSINNATYVDSIVDVTTADDPLRRYFTRDLAVIFNGTYYVLTTTKFELDGNDMPTVITFGGATNGSPRTWRSGTQTYAWIQQF